MSLLVSCIPIGFLESQWKGKIYCWFIGNSTHTLWIFTWAIMFIIWEKMGKRLGTARAEPPWSLRSASIKVKKMRQPVRRASLRPCRWSRPQTNKAQDILFGIWPMRVKKVVGGNEPKKLKIKESDKSSVQIFLNIKENRSQDGRKT